MVSVVKENPDKRLRLHLDTVQYLNIGVSYISTEARLSIKGVLDSINISTITLRLHLLF